VKYLLAFFALVVALLVFPGRTVAIVTLGVATAVWGTFIVWYHIRSKWWKNPYGRNLMGTAGGLFCVLALFFAGTLFQRYPGYMIAWAVVFTNLALLGIHRTYYMEMTQRGNGTERKN